QQISNGHTISNGHPSGLTATTTAPAPLDPSLLPHGSKSLSGTSLRSFLLGHTFGLSLLLAGALAYTQHRLWRAPFFLAALSLFHFLEYYTTARYNPAAATVAAFLLSQNGSAYAVAHSLAFLECLLPLPSPFALLPAAVRPWLLGLGFVMLLVGQMTRALAMAQAGSNFNHTVQMKRKEGHELVTDGVYAWLRHPSYFGFWWWGLGTQVVLGNGLCLVGYAVVLWKFFSGRIEREEELLVKFFGDRYIEYRQRTWVGIPFIP
ncbi:MAG: hypothetical protein LQ347_006771, partial [Umbilicaria vellea]